MGKPEISVIIPCVNSFDDFRRAADAALAQSGPVPEIIAVERLGPVFAERVRRDYPMVRLISVARDLAIPDMRAVAIRAAQAPVIGVIEDHVLVPPDWTRRMLEEIAAGADAVAGPVDNAAPDTLVNWAAFLCEYSAVLPPLPDGPAEGLPGNNTAYRAERLRALDAVLDEGKWENRLHDAIRAAGGRLVMRNDIVAGHRMLYSFGLYFSQRYLYSRSFAGARVQGQPAARRAATGLAAFALPPLVFARVVGNVRAKGRYGAHLVRSLPMLAAFALAWGAGEIAGYWFGPGRSLSKVR